MRTLALTLAGSLIASGCAITTSAPSDTTEIPVPAHTKVTNPYFERIARQSSKKLKDHAAIMAMQGNYVVGFHFQETVALQENYKMREDKTTGGFETVLVVKNDPNEIVLQHILVMGGYVIKHWRQDWIFEAKERFEFIADQSWEVSPIDDNKINGQWTQCVYEVSDAPRYCGTGKWNHRYGVSTWTSDRTWRPLPRREYTKRDDYNAINAENRHTITPTGWAHEQDNTKTLRDGRETKTILVREFGFNNYENIEGYDFQPAADYWNKTSDYWARVRAAWNRRLNGGDVLGLTTEVDGMPIIKSTFDQADKADQTTPADQVRSIEKLLSEWTVKHELSSGIDSGYR